MDETEVIVEQGVHNYSAAEKYVWPKDPEVLKKLEWFRDQKLAVMMHWGPYTELGLVASWALSDEDAEWSRVGMDWEISGRKFKEEYVNLNRTFNPIRFQPEEWAKLAKEAGARYLIFTTKHHDGFCMWDSRYSDYKITAPDCPFHTHKYADICEHLFEAFRRQGIAVGAYFSKADWHADSYWRKDDPRGDYMWRNPSYKPAEDPEAWERFVTYTHNQIKELAARYGKIDIMWFDAGWVCKENGQDIRLGEVVDEIRKWQPGMLCSDRTVGGAYENYITPEQCVPDEPMDVPWESSITLGRDYSFNFDDTYKSAREVICLLVDIVAKGGNLAINVGPQPDGRIPHGSEVVLKDLGAWLKKNGEAIYETRVCAPYKAGNIAFTRNGKKVYALEMFSEEKAEAAEELWIPYTGEISRICLLETGEELPFEKSGEGIRVKMPRFAGEKAPISRVLAMEEKIGMTERSL